jgi:hypothetical protein
MLGAAKGGKASAAALTRAQRVAKAKAAIAARWKATNKGRLTNDQQRVMAILRRGSPGKAVDLVATHGPAGMRRRAAISRLQELGKLRVIAEAPLSISVLAV